MIKDDEKRFWELMRGRCRKIGETGGEKPRQIIDSDEFFSQRPKRAWYLLEKWTGRGLYDYGTSLDLGWLTEKGIATVSLEHPKPPKIRWIRDQSDRLIFFKDKAGIYSEAIAAPTDETIVLKAIVQLGRRWIVAVPVERELINEPAAGDWSLASLNEEALFAAKSLEEFHSENPEIVWATLHPADERRRAIDAAEAFYEKKPK